MAFQVGLTLGSWNSSALYQQSHHHMEDWFYNQMTGYYMVLIDVMLLIEEHGRDWLEHALHTTPIGNQLANVGHGAARAVMWPAKSPFSPHHTREVAEEQHYGNVKSKHKSGLFVISHLHVFAVTCHASPLHSKHVFGHVDVNMPVGHFVFSRVFMCLL